MRISSIYNSTIYKNHRARNKATKHGVCKDITDEYKKSLLNKKVVEVKSRYDRYWGIGRRFPNQDPKLWQPQPKRVTIGKINGTKLWQYVSPRTLQQ